MISPIKCSHPRVICNPYLRDLVLSKHCIHEDGVTTNFSWYEINQMAQKWPYDRFSPARVKDLFDVNNYWIADTVSGEFFPMYYVVPCGKCDICREQKVKEWCFRVHCENACSSSIPLFITPSYNDANLPPDGVSKRHVQLFMKRLRILLERMGFDVAHKLRYFIVSEYGSPEKTFRPHYHGILWNFPYLDDNRLVNDVMTQEVIEKAWSYGFVKCLPLLTGGAAYVMKYMRKDGKVPEGKNKPFWMCSRRDGIGAQKCDELRDWCIDNPQELTVSVKDPYTGMTMTTSLPTYFKNRIFPTASRLMPKDIRDCFDELNEAYQYFCVYSSECKHVYSEYWMRVNERYAFLPRKYHGDVRSDLLYDMSGLPRRALAEIDVELNRRLAAFERCYLALMTYDFSEVFVNEVLQSREIRRITCLQLPLRCFDTDGLEYDITRRREEARRKLKL